MNPGNEHASNPAGRDSPDPAGRSRRGADGDVDALAVCTPGLEHLLDAELEALGVRRRRIVRGGVELAGLRQRQLYAANLWLRCATRVLVRVGAFRASSFAELEAGAARLDWARFVPPGVPVSFRVTSHRSRLHHTAAVAERLATAADAPLDTPADHHDDEGSPVVGPARFVVRLDADRCTISADSSGEPLYHRGWRREVARAPLRPTLAAATLAAIGWGQAPAGTRRLLVDPFCGSGTIPIEAALAASRRPSPVDRDFAFTRWADFAPGTWASVQATPGAGDGPQDGLPVIACADRDAGAVAATLANAARAGVEDLIGASVAAVGDLAPPSEVAGEERLGPDDVGWVVTNPPWGGRISGGGDLRDLYATFGRVVSERFGGWRVALVVADRHLAAHTGLSLHEVLRTTSGGQPVVVLVTPPLGSDRAGARRQRGQRGQRPARPG